MRTTATMPNPGTPMTGPDGRLNPEWTALIIALLTRTGGEGDPIDIVSLQKQVQAQAEQIANLFMLENSAVPGALIGALLLRIIALESMVQGVVPVQPSAPQTVPDAVSVLQRATTSIPDAVAIPRRDTDDLRKLIEAQA
ncbi:hypothetical protein DIE15_12240 [Burkholderia sp. Bp9031]|uniref:hypothetical protein n=1 Tax=Burkholderia sp. Bp9031 TaxID=2184566 RepID=UPI000F5DDC9D|nr:hypothetical protein [Burkholderia sp. Bp9031]RQZ17236.1 hypothetical protein DIE15_12240 [Burkholderia sp. Bp9031]